MIVRTPVEADQRATMIQKESKLLFWARLLRKHDLRLVAQPVPEARDVQGPKQRQNEEEEREEREEHLEGERSRIVEHILLVKLLSCRDQAFGQLIKPCLALHRCRHKCTPPLPCAVLLCIDWSGRTYKRHHSLLMLHYVPSFREGPHDEGRQSEPKERDRQPWSST